MEKINEHVFNLLDRASRRTGRIRPPSLAQLEREYPTMVRAYYDANDPSASYALVKVPYGPDILRLMRACRGYWVPEHKSWRVSVRQERNLADALYAISARSR